MTDIGERAQLKTIDVPMDEMEDGHTVFNLTVEKLQRAYNNASQRVGFYIMLNQTLLSKVES